MLLVAHSRCAVTTHSTLILHCPYSHYFFVFSKKIFKLDRLSLPFIYFHRSVIIGLRTSWTQICAPSFFIIVFFFHFDQSSFNDYKRYSSQTWTIWYFFEFFYGKKTSVSHRNRLFILERFSADAKFEGNRNLWWHQKHLLSTAQLLYMLCITLHGNEISPNMSASVLSPPLPPPSSSEKSACRLSCMCPSCVFSSSLRCVFGLPGWDPLEPQALLV